MPCIRKCNFDVSSGYFAGGPQEKFYRISTAMMIIVAYVIVNSVKDQNKCYTSRSFQNRPIVYCIESEKFCLNFHYNRESCQD